MFFPPGKALWLSALTAALVFIGVDAGLRLKTLDTIAPPENTARRQILESDDGYHWVMQTQQMLASGTWRVRDVAYDNAPSGREVHWSSPPHWWLAGIACAHRAVTGIELNAAVERAALYANPLWFFLFLIFLTPWTARHFGTGPAALLALGATVSVPFAIEFGAGSFDHHGFAAASALVTILALVAGWRTTDRSAARAAFILSGVAGAGGLWINAASQIPLLVGIGGGALLAIFLSPRGTPPTVSPTLWRWWGAAGASAALLAYGIEYFPAHLGWRLEVNHPLHALAWLAAGDWLARVQHARAHGAWFPRASDRLVAALGVVALFAPAALAFGFSEKMFVVRDAQLWRLHADYIAEFASPLAGLGGSGWSQLQVLFVQWNALPLIVGAAAGFYLLRPTTTLLNRATLALGVVPALLLLMMALSQQRWLSLACAAWLACAVAVLAGREKNQATRSRRFGFAALVTLVLAPYPIYLATRAPAVLRSEVAPSPANRHQLALRDVAQWLARRSAPDETVTVLSGPSATTSLIYFNPSLRGLGTLYWENLAGLRTSMAALGTNSPTEARTLFSQHGVQYLVVCSWASFARESARLHAGIATDQPAPADAFLLKLLNSRDTPPAWLRPLFYRLPSELTAGENEFVFVFEFAPTQSAQLAAVRRAQFLAAHGSTEAALEILQATLAQHPRFTPGLVALAQLHMQNRNVSALATTLPPMRSALAATPALDPEDRVLAALVFAATRAQPEARAQLDAAWRDLDARTLRQLAPGTLRLLVRLSQDLSATAPAELRGQAEALQAAESARN